MLILSEIEKQAEDFLRMAFDELSDKNFVLKDHWHIDHLCYRTSTSERYLRVKESFQSFSKLLIESEVNGRLISTFKLENAIHFLNWKIDLIEVPAPKQGKVTKDGFEHFELVCDIPFDEIIQQYAEFEYDDSGLAKDINQELEFPFQNFALKFHPLSLESVINIENNSSLTLALNEAEVLKRLKDFYPLIAGTYPLALNGDSSDLDILISGDIGDIKEKLLKYFSHHLEFKIEEEVVMGEPTLIASFHHRGIRFEIFAQKISSIKQTAYKHFLIEERILKMGGAELYKKILEARRKGIKTEPAFAQVIGIEGDPYHELLQMQTLSNISLNKLL